MGSAYLELVHGDCPNCGKKNSATMSASYWCFRASVCSKWCGERLHIKIKNGMRTNPDNDNEYALIPFQTEAQRIMTLRIEIKRLRSRIKSMNRQSGTP